uniref:Uncharacterized protein n=1 Tax=Steinernema glaseri TaxID=37863 RepID=A0A1I8ASA7_9BILA
MPFGRQHRELKFKIPLSQEVTPHHCPHALNIGPFPLLGSHANVRPISPSSKQEEGTSHQLIVASHSAAVPSSPSRAVYSFVGKHKK